MNEKFEQLIQKAKGAKESFGRDVSAKIYRTPEGALTVSRLSDRFHDVTVAALISRSDFTILDIQVKMERVPYDVCRETIGEVEKLKGLNVFHPAVVREVRRRIKRQDGCAHVFEILEFTLGSLFSGGPSIGLNGDHVVESDRELSPEEHRQLQKLNQRMQNTCRAFRTQG